MGLATHSFLKAFAKAYVASHSRVPAARSNVLGHRTFLQVYASLQVGNMQMHNGMQCHRPAVKIGAAGTSHDVSFIVNQWKHLNFVFLVRIM